MFELTQLRCFVALAEELHFGRAAARLSMSQPPLTRSLQQLEHVLGVTLVERSSRFVRLTTAGKAFLVDARMILRASEEAVLTARKVAGGEGGVITLGFVPAASYSLLPRLMTLVSTEMPLVQLILKEMVTAPQVDALTAGSIDAGLLRMPIDLRGMETVTVNREPFMVATPAAHPWVARDDLATKDLSGASIIMYAPMESRYHHDLLSSMFRLSGVLPKVVQYAREIHTVLALVSAGLGVALVPRSAANLAFTGVNLRPICLSPVIYSELTLAWRKPVENPALRVFTEAVLPRLLDGHA